MNPLRLIRSSQSVDSFLSALGSLRETRLTATLGFLAAKFPNDFGPLLGVKISPGDEIAVEETYGKDRYDVLIQGSRREHIIEGKIGPSQRIGQLLRYLATRYRATGKKPALTIVDDGSEFSQTREVNELIRKHTSRLRFVTWDEVARVCRKLVRKRKTFQSDPLGAVIAQDLADHLKENNMTKDDRTEVYLRDVGDVLSVELFFRHHIYKCQKNYYKSAHRNRYFAPYFTGKTTDRVSSVNIVPVGEGISFVAKVKSVQVVATKNIVEFLKQRKHQNAEEAGRLIRKNVRAGEIVVMLLGEPRMAFMSPVTKRKLRDKVGGYGLGAMGSRSCTFDDLLKASQ